MYRLSFLVLGAFIASLFAFSPSVSFAQSSKDSAHRTPKKAEPRRGLLPRNYYLTQFFHVPGDPENIFYMRLMHDGGVSGCFNITNPRYKIINNANQINLDVVDQEIYIRRRQPRYSNHDCKIKHANSIIDIRLDRDEMIENDVKRIVLTSARGGTFPAADIKLTKQKLELTVPNLDASFIDYFWFFPDNAVILHAPQAKQGDQQVVALLKEYGVSQGFTPMSEVLDGYTDPDAAYNYAMFVDTRGSVRNQLNTTIDQLPIGRIKPVRQIHGPNGPYDEPYEIEVFASLPGQEPVTSPDKNINHEAEVNLELPKTPNR